MKCKIVDDLQWKAGQVAEDKSSTVTGIKLETKIADNGSVKLGVDRWLQGELTTLENWSRSNRLPTLAAEDGPIAMNLKNRGSCWWDAGEQGWMCMLARSKLHLAITNAENSVLGGMRSNYGCILKTIEENTDCRTRGFKVRLICWWAMIKIRSRAQMDYSVR